MEQQGIEDLVNKGTGAFGVQPDLGVVGLEGLVGQVFLVLVNKFLTGVALVGDGELLAVVD